MVTFDVLATLFAAFDDSEVSNGALIGLGNRIVA